MRLESVEKQAQEVEMMRRRFFARKHHLNGFCYGTIAHDFGDGMSRTQLQDLQTKMMDAKARLTTVIDRNIA